MDVRTVLADEVMKGVEQFHSTARTRGLVYYLCSLVPGKFFFFRWLPQYQ